MNEPLPDRVVLAVIALTIVLVIGMAFLFRPAPIRTAPFSGKTQHRLRRSSHPLRDPWRSDHPAPLGRETAKVKRVCSFERLAVPAEPQGPRRLHPLPRGSSSCTG